MKLHITALFDTKAGIFHTPMFTRSRIIAERWLFQQIADFNSDLSKTALDLSLFELGHFDDETGTFDLHTAPLNIVNGGPLKAAIIAEVKGEKGV
jgi:hypothetical protein